MMTLDMALFDLPMIIRLLTSLLNTRLTSNFPYVLKQKTLEINLSFIIGIHLIDYLNTMNMVHPIHWDLGSIIDLFKCGLF